MQYNMFRFDNSIHSALRHSTTRPNLTRPIQMQANRNHCTLRFQNRGLV